MKTKNVIFIFLIFLSCCKEDPDPAPIVDPEIEQFKTLLTGEWKSVRTELWYNSDHTGQAAFFKSDEIDCQLNYSIKFDIVKTMSISDNLEVTNTYFCTPSRKTRFTIQKGSSSRFIINELNDKDEVVKVYTTPPFANSGPIIYLISKEFDNNFFSPISPAEYVLVIEKQ